MFIVSSQLAIALYRYHFCIALLYDYIILMVTKLLGMHAIATVLRAIH